MEEYESLVEMFTFFDIMKSMSNKFEENICEINNSFEKILRFGERIIKDYRKW